MLHVSVIGFFLIKKQGEINYFKHLIMPIIGFAVVAYVFIHLDMLSLELGAAWSVVGAIYYIILKLVKGKAEINAEM